MTQAHHVPYVALSLLVAILGSWTALDLFRRVRTHVGRARRLWLITAALAMVSSIWSMHFIAMLGFDPGAPVRYDLRLTILSLALAILATVAAAIFAARRERSVPWRIATATLVGGAIVGVHYIAMAVLRPTPVAASAALGLGLSPLVLALEVAGGILVILLLSLAASLYDRRLDVLGALEAGSVGYWELALPQMTLSASARAKEIYGRTPSEPLAYDDLLAVVHPDDRERRQLMLDRALSQGVGYDTEHRIVLADGEERWINVRGRVLTHSSGRRHRMTGIIMDVTDRHVAFASVAESEGRFRQIADGTPALVWMTDAQGHATFANRHFETIFGVPAADFLGGGWVKVVVAEDLKDYLRTFDRAMRARSDFQYFTRARDRYGRVLWFRCEGAARFDADGEFLGYAGCNVDVTEAKVAQDRQQILINELNHRVKNTLATVQSIADQTARRAQSPADFREKFETRLIALSQTHNALTRRAWESASLTELLTQEFGPYAGEQVQMSGPEVDLPPRMAVTLGMVFHELATNAAKYGALASPAGCVRVSWRTVLASADARLILEWREEGGPPVRTPTHRGFGSRLIEGSVKGELGGISRVSFDPAGLSYRLEVELSETQGAVEQEPGAAAG